MSRKIWEINTKNGFVNCIGYTKQQALEIIVQSILLDEKEKIQEEQKKKKACEH